MCVLDEGASEVVRVASCVCWTREGVVMCVLDEGGGSDVCAGRGS